MNTEIPVSSGPSVSRKQDNIAAGDVANCDDYGTVENNEDVKLPPAVDRQPTSFALENVVSTSIRSKGEEAEVLMRLETFLQKYQVMLDTLRVASRRVEKAGKYGEIQLRSAAFILYRRKLAIVTKSIVHINSKIRAIQLRLNDARKQLPSQQSLVEQGSFYYRCVYQGGVRYRDYPSSGAQMLKDNRTCEFEQVVKISERVFIGGEQSVFLHHQGVGWLFENLKDLVCFERVPFSSNDRSTAPIASPAATSADVPSSS